MKDRINSDIKGYILTLIDNDKIDNNKCMQVLNISMNAEEIYTDIKKSYNNFDIYNIEIDDNPEVNFRDKIKSFKEKQFDYIIIYNSISSFYDPDNILKEIKKYLTPEGYIICNIPNLMNYNIVNNLINGKFNYDDNSIVNYRNVRFFTLRQIQTLFDDSRYDLNSILSVSINDEEDKENIIDSLCNLSNNNLRYQFQAYEYIVKASPKNSKTFVDFVINN